MAEDQIFGARANARDAIAGGGLARHPGPPRMPGRLRRTRPPAGRGPGPAADPRHGSALAGPAKTSSSRQET